LHSNKLIRFCLVLYLLFEVNESHFHVFNSVLRIYRSYVFESKIMKYKIMKYKKVDSAHIETT